MDRQLQESVRRRSGFRCEYCHFPAALAELPFQFDHIVAQKHGGTTTAENLAFACFYCNSYKGPNVAGLDPDTGRLVRLFHPRRDDWAEHFRWEQAWLAGRTAVGRVTIEVLRINHPDAITLRESLIAEGAFPGPTPPRITG